MKDNICHNPIEGIPKRVDLKMLLSYAPVGKEQVADEKADTLPSITMSLYGKARVDIAMRTLVGHFGKVFS